MKRGPGRPKGTKVELKYRPEDYIDEIIGWIAAGRMLREYCRQPGKPCYRTVYNWLDANEVYATRFARARDDGHEVLAQECAELADTRPADQVEVQWRRLQIDTRLKLLAKWNPKKWGDRQAVDHAGGIEINVVTGVPRANKA